MDFELNDQERALRDLARDFAERHVRPGILDREWEPDPHKRMPWDIIDAASAAGLRTLTVPAEYGGPDPAVSEVARALVVEEIAVADPSAASFIQIAMKDPAQIAKLGSKEQKDWFFPQYMQDPRCLTCTAGTEPAHGSDWTFPYEDFHFDTTAHLDGDEWVLNGEKYSISNGVEAKLLIVFAATDTSATFSKGSSMFVMPRVPGVHATQVHPKVGLRLLNNARIVFDNARIPKNALVGELHGASENRKRTWDDVNLLAAAIELGITRAAFEESTAYAKMRVQGGRPIIEHQAIGLKLSEIYTIMESIRAMVYRLAWMMDNPSKRDPKYSPMLTWYAAEATYRAATLAVHIMGCGGNWMSLSGQKHVRDALVFFPTGGTHTMQLLKVNRGLIAEAPMEAAQRYG